MTTSLGGGANLALFTDLYELTMAQAYVADGMAGTPATFSLFVRTLPTSRNYLLACGLETVLDALTSLRFDADQLGYLRSLGKFTPSFLDWLQAFRFRGDIVAIAEGTPVFAGEPLLEVTGPLGQCQLVETLLINLMQLQTMLASKASRIVTAAAGRRIVDFGARRVHGIDASVHGARAFAIAGVSATSNMLAGQILGLPVVGTMAHAYVQSFAVEADAFRAFARTYPDTTLLVDTYDTLQGVAKVIALAAELGPAFRVQAIRLDSGDLVALSRAARAMLDAAGLSAVRIFASGGLDEDEIASVLKRGAPIDAFGVGTRMSVSEDAPALDVVYKLTALGGKGRVKLSPGKNLLPGRKQVWRTAERDILGRAEESHSGRALLQPVLRAGERVGPPRSIAAIAAHAQAELAQLPERLRSPSPATPPYRVEVSPALTAYAHEVQAALKRP